MNWTSPTTSTVVGSSHSRGPSGVLPGLCSGVRRILLALVKALALDAPLAPCERPGRWNGPARTRGLVLSPCAMRAVGIVPCLCSVLP
jgi:hypothetical protein